VSVPTRKVSPTQTHLEETAMNRTLTALRIAAAVLIAMAILLAAAFTGSSAFAAEGYGVLMENGKQRIDSGVNGNQMCVIIDDKLICAAMN
jgi:hypothetical protein